MKDFSYFQDAAFHFDLPFVCGSKRRWRFRCVTLVWIQLCISWGQVRHLSALILFWHLLTRQRVLLRAQSRKCDRKAISKLRPTSPNPRSQSKSSEISWSSFRSGFYCSYWNCHWILHCCCWHFNTKYNNYCSKVTLKWTSLSTINPQFLLFQKVIEHSWFCPLCSWGYQDLDINQ